MISYIVWPHTIPPPPFPFMHVNAYGLSDQALGTAHSCILTFLSSKIFKIPLEGFFCRFFQEKNFKVHFNHKKYEPDSNWWKCISVHCHASLKSDNLQQNTLVCLADGTNDQASDIQSIFLFHNFLFRLLHKNRDKSKSKNFISGKFKK